MLSSIQLGNRSPRILLCLSFNNVRVSRGLSFRKLAKNLMISLSILKLDGSSIGIEVSMNATVAGIKSALEETFGSLTEYNHCEISWLHVWGHFCLCYEGQKLVDDRASIRKIGIKDGDQICEPVYDEPYDFNSFNKFQLITDQENPSRSSVFLDG